jgi:hypothetical protein
MQSAAVNPDAPKTATVFMDKAVEERFRNLYATTSRLNALELNAEVKERFINTRKRKNLVFKSSMVFKYKYLYIL